MRVTPLDIRKQPFPKTFRGYDTEAVNSFLEMIASEFEKAIKQVNMLDAEVESLKAQIKVYEKFVPNERINNR